MRDGYTGPRTPDEIGVQTLRGGDMGGEHTVFYFGEGERLEITHALLTAEFSQEAQFEQPAGLPHNPRDVTQWQMSSLEVDLVRKRASYRAVAVVPSCRANAIVIVALSPSWARTWCIGAPTFSNHLEIKRCE